MAEKTVPADFKFTSSARYLIRVKGFLDESWSDRLSGMTIENQVIDNELPVASLHGLVRDQGQLLGLMNSIYELHLPIVSIELLDLKNNHH